MARRRITRSGIYQKLDRVAGTAEEWLSEKEILDAELIAEEGMSDTELADKLWGNVFDRMEYHRDDEDLEEWVQREYA